MENRRPRSSQRVLTWQEDAATVTEHRVMQFAEECVETKTVTTTTTTKRSYPPLFIREPRDLNLLDSKEYPLASRPTPLELRKLTFDLGDHDADHLSSFESDVIVRVRQDLPESAMGLLHCADHDLGSLVPKYRLYHQCPT